MSAEGRFDLEVNLDENRASGTFEFNVKELFVDGELRLWETPAGWRGYVFEDGSYYWVDTQRDLEAWPARGVRVGSRAVQDGVIQHILNPAAGGSAPSSAAPFPLNPKAPILGGDAGWTAGVQRSLTGLRFILPGPTAERMRVGEWPGRNPIQAPLRVGISTGRKVASNFREGAELGHYSLW